MREKEIERETKRKRESDKEKERERDALLNLKMLLFMPMSNIISTMTDTMHRHNARLDTLILHSQGHCSSLIKCSALYCSISLSRLPHSGRSAKSNVPFLI